MKNLILLFTLITTSLFAQTGINYQGAATNSDGVKLANQNISLRISVLQGGVEGTTSYSETHSTTTDQFGLFNVVIGQGFSISGDFETISWGSGDHFLKVELDATGGTNYNLVSTTQMMSVPYALYAKNAGLDSSAVANMLASMDILYNYNKNCDFIFPEGINGEIIYFDFPQDSNEPYIVPDGKKLYLTSFDGESIIIDNISEFNFNNNNKPTILSSGQALKKQYDYNRAIGQGILINNNPDVEAVTINIETGDNYIVPEGKKLYINNWENGHPVISSKVFYFHKWHTLPLIVKSGEILSTEGGSNLSFVNGYLVDEDYFEDCGGGGGSVNYSPNSSSTFSNNKYINPVYPYGVEDIEYVRFNAQNEYSVPEGNVLLLYTEGLDLHKLIYNGEDCNNNCSMPAGKYFIADENSTLKVNEGSQWWSGYLLNKNHEVVNIVSNNGFTVPEGKKYIHLGSHGYFVLNYSNVLSNNHNDVPTAFYKIFNSGDFLENESTSNPNVANNRLWGFLVDEDYFESSSSSSSSNSGGGGNTMDISVSQYGDTLTIGNQSVIVPGLSSANLQLNNNEYGSVTDIDGNTYRTKIFGDAEWMIENLRTQVGNYYKVSDDPGLPQNGGTYTVDFFQSYEDSVGYYYQTNCCLCPTGWHIPSVQEFQELHFEIYGSYFNEDGSQNNDENYQLLWSTHQNGTNQSGFNLFRTGEWLQANFVQNHESIHHEEEMATFMTSSVSDVNTFYNLKSIHFYNNVDYSYNWSIFINSHNINNSWNQVRCVKD